ncbi:protein LITTLE ZIPPER 1-like [Panicum miliaceum]|uniref:Protein LITTLE ZIPPER 1-like n=1 Tax=Panicum miliaceum TaxID=4540 RepID=A0A3L6QME3_PANMI|nr:protein LITTLE ZIPPER 1-like [Panicum miliaceum]
MCSGSWSTKGCPSLVVFNLKRRQQQTKPHVLVAIRRRRLRLRRSRAGAEAMEMVNLKLYLENRCIIAENERLKEKARALRRENLALRQNLSKTTAEAELPAAGAGAGAA